MDHLNIVLSHVGGTHLEFRMNKDLQRQYAQLIDELQILNFWTEVDRPKIHQVNKKLGELRKQIVQHGDLAESEMIALAVLRTVDIHEESYDESKLLEKDAYSKSSDASIKEACKEFSVDPRMVRLLGLAFHWWNDVQDWANDVLSGK